jgi:hypothetical protein
MDRAGALAILLALAASACAPQDPSAIQVVARDCRIALPYVAAEVTDCTPRTSAAYDFAFCHVHYVVAVSVAPRADKARGEAGLWAEFRRKAITYGNVSKALSDAETFERNVGLARKYYESLQKQNPMIAGSSLEYVRGKCDNLAAHHAAVLQGLGRTQRL